MTPEDTVSARCGETFTFEPPEPTAQGQKPRDPAVLASSGENQLWWSVTADNTYECEVWVEEEDDGGFSAFAARLPGVVAQGDDFEGTLSEIQEALSATLASYRARDKKIPWTEEPIESEEGRSITKRWLLVDV